MTHSIRRARADAGPVGSPLGVALIDQVPLFREALTARILRDPRLRLIGSTSQLHTAVTMRDRFHLDVLVIDCVLDPRGHLIRMLREPDTTLAVLVLVREPYRTAEYLATALDAGATGLVPRCAPPETILDAIRRGHTEPAHLDPTLRPLAAAPRSAPRPEQRPISQREYQVLQLIADGLSNQAVAQALYVSVETVRTHIKSILRKLGARDRAHAVAMGFRLGLLAPHAERPAAPSWGTAVPPRIRVARPASVG